MGILEITAVLVALAAAFAFINHKLLRMPATIGLMLLGLLHAIGVLAAGLVWPGAAQSAETFVRSIDFNETLMHGMLGYLLFAGALHVNLNDLRGQSFVVGLLATVGVLFSTFSVGGAMYLILPLLGLELDLIYCLLFGSLIAPTDPIAVLSILKSLGAPKTLETKITGESLFNDGVGVVVFLALLGFAGLGAHGHAEAPSTSEVAKLFAVEAGGGALFGLGLGLLAYTMLRSIDDYKTEILISLALVTGGYCLASLLHLSGPIAMVVAGLLIGNQGRTFAMSHTTREHLDTFWELVDEMLNAVLFVLIGLEVLVLTLDHRYLLAGVLAIPLSLLARFISVGGVVTALRPFRQGERAFTPHATKVMVWGGLRGGISIALALSLKDALSHSDHAETQATTSEIIVTMTYVVVAFSILAQGLTMGPLLRKLGLAGQAPADAH